MTAESPLNSRTQLDVGFSGTRRGMSDAQWHVVEGMIQMLGAGRTLICRHGDCRGADDQFHDIVLGLRVDRALDARLVIHPPSDSRLRAHRLGDVVMPPKPYLQRDADIAKFDVLIAAPDGPERRGSGTWATIRMAQSDPQRPIAIVRSSPVDPDHGCWVEYLGGPWPWPRRTT